MEDLVVTIEDRIELTEEVVEYFKELIPLDERIKQIVWQKITRDGIRDKKTLVKFVMETFKVSKRRANSIVTEMQGRFKALKELTREQIRENWQIGIVFQPGMDGETRRRLLKGWEKAVKCALAWADAD